MASYRLAYIILLVCGAVFSQVYAGHLSSVIFISLLIMPITSLIITVIQRFAFKLTFDSALQKAERGDDLKFQLTALNRFILPCSNILIIASMPGTMDKKTARLIFSLCPFQKKNLYLTYAAEFRGEYEISLDNVYFYDCFKLFKISKRLGITKKILIVPKLYDTAASQPLSVTSDEESQAQISNSMGTERSFVRKYADGDDVRKIHWKLSSKQEDYMVWQSAKSHTVENIVICDMSCVIPQKAKSSEQAEKKSPDRKNKSKEKALPPVFGAADRTNALYSDAIIETALSISFYNVKNDRKTFISYFDGEQNQKTFLSTGTLEQIYNAAIITAKAKTYSGKPDFAETAKEIFLNNNGKGAVIITHCRDMRIARIAEELRALSEFILIIVGNPEKNVKNYIEKLSGVKLACLNPEIPEKEIPSVIEKIYKV